MKVIIAHTKVGEHADFVYSALEKGCKAHGDTVQHIHSVPEVRHIADADVVMQVSYPFIAHKYVFCDEYDYCPASSSDVRSPINHFRMEVFEAAVRNKKRLLSLDSGLLNFVRRSNKNYYQLSYDSIKNLGKFYNYNSPSDRFDELGIEIKPWKTDNVGNVVVFGQVRYGVGSQHVDVRSWMRAWMCQYLEIEHPNRHPILFRGHPNNPNEYRTEKIGKLKRIKFSSAANFKKDLLKAACAVTFCSHVIAETVVEGIPSFCYSKTSMGYPLFMANSMDDILNLKFPEREQWLYDMAYTQWYTTELENGVAWNHYRPHALKIEDVDWDAMVKPVCST